jgi:CheY-like chemotaxis protein
MSNELKIEIVPISEVMKDKVSAFRPVILVVDDERLIADTLSVILSGNGFDVLTAYDGESALELARRSAPNLLLTDVMMPGMTGIELALALTKTAPSCKVLLFSGQAATVDLLATAKEQGHQFNLLEKPIHPSDLISRISDCFSSESPADQELDATRMDKAALQNAGA